MSRTVTVYNDGSFTTNTPVPSYFPRFARVKHWHERYFNPQGQGLSYVAANRMLQNNPHLYGTNCKGLPSVFKLNMGSADHPVVMTEKIQRWMFRMLKESTGMLDPTQCWRNLTEHQKAYTNGMGREDGYTDWILGVNLVEDSGMKLDLTIANGATIKILGDKFKRGGEWVYPFEVLNASDPSILNLTYAKAWWLVFAATNSTVDPVTEGRVDPFPYGGARDVPVPLLANNTTVGHIESGWVEFLPVEHVGRAFPYYRSLQRPG